MSNMSIYIPSVTPTTTEDQVKSVFYNLWIGQVSRVDFVERDDSENYMAFVHFDYWYNHANAYYLQKRIIEHGQSRIVYNDPYYWIVMKNNAPLTVAEVELERRIKFLENEVSELSKKNAYLMRVIETHTRTFMDNGITTNQVKHCSDCFIEMPLSDKDCPPCESLPDLEPPRPATPPPRPRTPEEDDSDALALTGALSQSGYRYKYKPPPPHSDNDNNNDNDNSSHHSLEEVNVENTPEKVLPQPNNSGWFWWS